MSDPTFSFVTPLFNEEHVLEELHRRDDAVADSLDGPSEFVLVDDGSEDRTAEIANDLHLADPRVKLVSLSRNFGHQLAISAGRDYASGEAVVIMDGDHQDPPEVVPEMVERWPEGNDEVYAVRTAREGETRFKSGTPRTGAGFISIAPPQDDRVSSATARGFHTANRRCSSLTHAGNTGAGE
jgi:dolichol-phosphate mannosyltransferase